MPSNEVIKHFAVGAALTAVTQILYSPIERYQKLVQLRRTMTELLEEGKVSQDDFDIDITNFTQPSFFPSKIDPASDMFRGAIPSILRYFPTQIINYATKDRVVKLLKGSFEPKADDGPVMKMSKNAIMGGIVGSVSLAFVYGFDVYTNDVRLGIEGIETSSGSKFKKERRSSIISYYDGFLVSIFGIIVYRGLHIGLWDAFKSTNDTPQDAAKKGFVITMMAGLLSYPLDTVRNRQVMTGENALEAFTNIVSKYGVFALWDGVLISISKGIIGAGIMSAWMRM